jgi:hypothetical protein
MDTNFTFVNAYTIIFDSHRVKNETEQKIECINYTPLQQRERGG